MAHAADSRLESRHSGDENLQDAELKLAKAVHHETLAVPADFTLDDVSFLESYPDKARRRALWKVDIRLLPLLCLCYICSFIDRANIGNAKIEGLMDDLDLDAVQYNTCLAIFFIPYVLLVKKPSWYIGALVVSWGTVMTLAGFVQNFGGLLAVRFFLGVAEAGFFPGAVYLCSTWYLPNETQSRIAIFYTASALSGAFSGLLAAGISQMKGVAGLAGWRWIFILEGLATVMLGMVVVFGLPDTPDLSPWLQPDEARFLKLRQQADPSRRSRTPTESGKSDFKTFLSVVTDWQLYLMALIFWGNSVPNNGLKFSMPQIIKNMGYTSTTAQLMTAPPYIAGAISSYVTSVFADRYRWRAPFIAGPMLLVVISYAALFSKADTNGGDIPVMYTMIFIACIGLYPLNPATSSWTLDNLAGPRKRAMGIAYMICLGNVGGLIGSYIFIDTEKPKYPTGYGASLAFSSAGICAVVILESLYKMINRKRGERTEEEVRGSYSDEELEALGDRSPLFRFSL